MYYFFIPWNTLNSPSLTIQIRPTFLFFVWHDCWSRIHVSHTSQWPASADEFFIAEFSVCPARRIAYDPERAVSSFQMKSKANFAVLLVVYTDPNTVKINAWDTVPCFITRTKDKIITSKAPLSGNIMDTGPSQVTATRIYFSKACNLPPCLTFSRPTRGKRPVYYLTSHKWMINLQKVVSIRNNLNQW